VQHDLDIVVEGARLLGKCLSVQIGAVAMAAQAWD
jgi:hypothetical protein